MAERSIVDIGRFLQGGGLRVRENSAFGGVSPGVHSPQGYHPHDEAIDVTDWRDEVINGLDWKQRTKGMRDRFSQLGLSEVLGPGDKNHDEHLHLALKGKKFLSEQQLLWARDGRYQDGQGQWLTTMPGMPSGGGTGTVAGRADQTVTETVTERQVPADWKAAASAADRATDPSSQGYWQRQDIKLWAQANPELAKQAMAKAGADAAWLQAPAMTTVTERTTTAAPAAAAQAPQTQAPQTQAPQAQAPQVQAPKPENRGALGGTRVGGQAPRGLQPYVFEIHADNSADQGGKTGFIGSYLDRDNPLFQSINRTYGNYGPNHSRTWRDGDLGAPRHGVSIIETRTAGPGMGDSKAQETEANRLYGTLMADPDVKSGKRPLVFFAGHADTTNSGQQGATGGDAAEKTWNTGVMSALRRRAMQEGRTNFQFMDSIVDNDDKGTNTNWARAKALRDQWAKQNGGE
ncbi:MAG: hypothetical protein LW834_08130 [Cyanobium sp. 49614_E6]|jgi:hypothetical protein|nr:hypothetical protein [Cyanobium sp. 49614_E6]